MPPSTNDTTAVAAPAGASQWELLRTLVMRNLWLRSKRSLLGMIWPAMLPLVMLALYSFVFNRVFDVPVDRYPEYLFAGLIPWAFLSQSVGAAMSTLSMEAMLIRRAPFPFELIPLATVATMALYFGATIVGFAAYLGYHGRLEWALLPLILAPAYAVILLVGGICQVLALLDVYNRDLRWVVGNILTIWFFLLPIVYRQEMAPDSLLFLRSVDPMNMIVGQFRAVLYHGDINRPLHMALMVVVCTVFFAGTRALFHRWSGDLAKDV